MAVIIKEQIEISRTLASFAKGSRLGHFTDARLTHSNFDHDSSQLRKLGGFLLFGSSNKRKSVLQFGSEIRSFGCNLNRFRDLTS